jgi:hypothetical protein
MHLDAVEDFCLLGVGLWRKNQFAEVLSCCNHFIVSFFDFSEYFCRLRDFTTSETPVSMLSFKNTLVGLAVEFLVINFHAL